MKYQPGDKVLILHSKEEAQVVEIINEKMVFVDVNGIRFPVYVDQIDFPYFHNFSAKKIVVPNNQKVYVDNLKKEEVSQKYHVHSGVWISFLPVFDKNIFDDDVVEIRLGSYIAENFNKIQGNEHFIKLDKFKYVKKKYLTEFGFKKFG